MQRVVVTGGAAGIGKAIADAFVDAGHRVYVCDVDRDALDAAGRQTPARLTRSCDVGDRAQVDAMVADAASRLGGIDVLVNNAGVAGPTAPVRDVDPDDWDAVLKANLTGAFLVTRAAIPHLIASGRGSIVFLSSAAGRLGYPNRSPYATAKWGLIGLMKTVAMELGVHGVRSNAILPGAVDGERIRRVFDARATATGATREAVEAAAFANQSLRLLVDPKDIGAFAVFLASDAAKSISGQALPIDGDLQRN